MKSHTVLDIFCGAGGFSEGFRQQGFSIVRGVDRWQPAIDTFNHNFNLSFSKKNILDLRKSIKEIEDLPDTEIIIGSPPCVSFSHSNLSGKADKKSGVLLTEIFLRIVAVKKFKKNSKLKAWLMENVANSTNYLNNYYTFKDLNLTHWAKKNNLSPDKKAIILEGNQAVVNSAEYGSPQKRYRVISGELIVKSGSKLVNGHLPVPPKTHGEQNTQNELPNFYTVSCIKNGLPTPNSLKSDRLFRDPQYPTIELKVSDLTDHFYDTGLYKCEWEYSEYSKTNHPYMGKMSFPENEDRPSRTITATKIGSSREAIIYRSEFNRVGDGEFRTPTVREAACIMGFPTTYQFTGSESTKWRLVGNAVCPSVSRAFAKQLRSCLNMVPITENIVQLSAKLEGITNLNTYSAKVFDTPPKKNKNARFRRQPFKDGNMTVTLSNYNIKTKESTTGKWFTSVQYGTGEGFPIYNFPDDIYHTLEPILRGFNKGNEFIEIINNGFSEMVPKTEDFQRIYESRDITSQHLGPAELVLEVSRIIKDLGIGDEKFVQNGTTIFTGKQSVPLKQVFALYAINKIVFIANS